MKLPAQIKLLHLALLFIILSGIIYSQSKPVCSQCGKEIAGQYLQVEGKSFHPEHFMCNKCRAPIAGSYQKKGEDYYHPDCLSRIEGLVCCICGEVIKGQYVNSGEKIFHEDCYKEKAAVRCAVCGEPILGAYFTNIYEDAYHSAHNSEYDKCDNCGRIICQRLTKGGSKISDGRLICNLCLQGQVSSSIELDNLLTKVFNRLKTFGIYLNRNNITIQQVNRTKLVSFFGSAEQSDELRGFCNSKISESFTKDRKSKTTYSHAVYVLNYIPAIQVEGIIAHELMHAWMNENVKKTHPNSVVEGSCNYISYQYISQSQNSERKYILKRMEESADPVYGKGFMDIKKKFAGLPTESLLNYLK